MNDRPSFGKRPKVHFRPRARRLPVLGEHLIRDHSTSMPLGLSRRWLINLREDLLTLVICRRARVPRYRAAPHPGAPQLPDRW